MKLIQIFQITIIPISLIIVELIYLLLPELKFLYKLLIIEGLSLAISLAISYQIQILLNWFEPRISKDLKNQPSNESSNIYKIKTDNEQKATVYTGYRYTNNNKDMDAIYLRELIDNFGLTLSFKIFRAYQLAKTHPMKKFIFDFTEEEKEIIKNKGLQL